MIGNQRTALQCRSFGVSDYPCRSEGLSGAPTRQQKFAKMRVSLIPSDTPAERKDSIQKARVTSESALPVYNTTDTAMQTGQSMGIVASTALSLLTATLAYYLVAQYTCNGLSRYPGPWLAKFTKFWHRLSIKSNQHQRHLLQLHQKYGDVVRIGPNNLSIANPKCIPHIYGVKNEFLKVQHPLIPLGRLMWY